MCESKCLQLRLFTCTTLVYRCDAKRTHKCILHEVCSGSDMSLIRVNILCLSGLSAGAHQVHCDTWWHRHVLPVSLKKREGGGRRSNTCLAEWQRRWDVWNESGCVRRGAMCQVCLHLSDCWSAVTYHGLSGQCACVYVYLYYTFLTLKIWCFLLQEHSH